MMRSIEETMGDYTIEDAKRHGFDSLELYKLWHWNTCFPTAVQYETVDSMIKSVRDEIHERFVELPVDVDGVPIHVGDVLNPPKGSEEYGTLVVAELMHDGEDWYFKGEAVSLTGEEGYFNVLGFTHRKPDSWKQIIMDTFAYHTGNAPRKFEEFESEIKKRCIALAAKEEKCKA